MWLALNTEIITNTSQKFTVGLIMQVQTEPFSHIYAMLLRHCSYHTMINPKDEPHRAMYVQ